MVVCATITDGIQAQRGIIVKSNSARRVASTSKCRTPQQHDHPTPCCKKCAAGVGVIIRMARKYSTAGQKSWIAYVQVVFESRASLLAATGALVKFEPSFEVIFCFRKAISIFVNIHRFRRTLGRPYPPPPPPEENC